MDADAAWTWGARRVAAHVAERLGVTVTGTPERLSGGLLNVVWRVPVAGATGSVVVKVAPPFVASQPYVPLSPSRLLAEARALAALPSLYDPSPQGGVPRRGTEGVRTPRLLDLDAERSVLVMTDAGALPHLGAWLASATGDAARDALGQLGTFVGRLHAATLHATDLLTWHQPDVAATRLAIQYGAVGGWLRDAGVAEADALGAIARDLGERWLAPGRCVVMGDLWPPSVLVDCPHSPSLSPHSLTVIDWELSTAGEPAQDLGHLAAHLWLLGRSDLWPSFTRGWHDGAGETLAALLAHGTAADVARHAACEVLARTVGAFADGRDSREAVEVAASWLREPTTAFTG